MRSKTTLGLVIALLGMLSAACIAEVIGIEGSGNVITETRDVSGFDEIVLSGSGRVVVDVTGTESLSIEAEDNIMPELETVVRDGKLMLETKRSIDPTVEIVYTITATAIDGVTISGSGLVTVTGVDGADFLADISGSGNVDVEGSLSGRLSVNISGSGGVDAEDLVATEGQVDVSGSGRAVVNVTDDLFISLSGSGAVEYIGSPSVEIDKSGSGVVTQRD